MNFDFSEQERQFHMALETVVADFDAPENRDAGRDGVDPDWIRSRHQALAGIGYLKLGLEEPPDKPCGSLHLMACQEILASACQSLFLTMEMNARMFGRIIHTWGTRHQKAQLLARVKDGEILGSVALSENAMNVTNDPLATEGTETDDGVLVSGVKRLVVNASFADCIAVVGRMHDRTAIFLVDKKSAGLQVDDGLATIGYEAAGMAGIRLDGCRVPPAMVVLPGDEKVVIATLRRWENQILIGASLGMMKAAFLSAKAFANTHHTGGKPIIAYQEVAFKLAEMLALYQTSQLLAYRTAWTTDNNQRERDGLTLCAKVFCTESAEKVASQALQVLSDTGYQRGHQAAIAYTCAKYAQIAGTSTEIARVMIGDEALGYR